MANVTVRTGRATSAWLIGAIPSAVVLVVGRAIGVDRDLIAALVLVPVAIGSAVGGRRTGAWIAAAAGVAYAVALLAPFGHVRIGLTHDMAVLVIFVAVASLVGHLADRRQPVAAAPPDADPAELLNAVSHDLRNPLSTIRAASTDLLHGQHADDAARRDELLGLVVSEAERLDRIVGNLLHAGRARAGRIVPHAGPESLRRVVGESLDRLGQIHPQPLVNEVDPRLPAVLIDAVLIDQVIGNLVENAVRVSPPGAAVRVSAACASPGTVEVTVHDDGPGFTLVDGDPFEAYVSASGSTGLGLSICRAIVTAHGGAIAAVDTGTGGCVRFTLPVAADV